MNIHDFSILEKNLEISFKDKDLLIQAFAHRSFLNENPDFKLFHNERLEFLGDAVLELVVTEYLFFKYPKKTEGELTALRAALVNSKMLSSIAKELNFNDFLLLSEGERKGKERSRQYILANVFESFTGSLYIDQGLDVCKFFIDKYLIKELPRIIENSLFKSAKSLFQEISQEEKGITPTYSVLEERGPDHAKHFTVGVFLGKKLISQGDGSSKQEAEESAAKKALEGNNSN